MRRAPDRVALGIDTVPDWPAALRAAGLVGILAALVCVVVVPGAYRHWWGARVVPQWATVAALEARVLDVDERDARRVDFHRMVAIERANRFDLFRRRDPFGAWTAEDLAAEVPAARASLSIALLVGCVTGALAAFPLLMWSWFGRRPARLILTRDWVELDGERIELADLDALEVHEDRLVVGRLTSTYLMRPREVRRHLEDARLVLRLDGRELEAAARAEAIPQLARLRAAGPGGE